VDDDNSPWRTTLIRGIRGSGKTALLSDIRVNLDERNVISVDIVPNEAILENILTQLYRQLPKGILKTMPRLKSINLTRGVSVDFDGDKDRSYFKETFSYQIMEMMDAFMKKGKHIVFLVDEVQKHTEGMRIFISTYQNLIMREYSVSMVMAGLPSAVSKVLNDKILTFLRRAKQIDLNNIELIIIEHEFKKVFANEGSILTDEVVSKAAACTHGYPYLIQLIGYYLWEDMKNGSSVDVLEDVLVKAKAELFQNVHSVVFDDLSNQDRNFVFAMYEDEGVSSVSDIGKRMQKEKNQLSPSRNRLITAKVIKPAGHGLLSFSYPYMKEFLLYKKLELEY